MCIRSNRFTRFALLLTLAAVLTVATTAAAGDISKSLRVPEAGVTQMITLSDGSTMAGQITEVGDTTVKFKTQMGEMTLDIDKIVEIKEIATSAIKGGRYWYPDPNRHRLFVGPTGRMLKAGQGYFSDMLIFFPSVGYGITDNINLSAGMTIIPGIDFSKQLFYATPKIGVSINKNLSVSGSALIIAVPQGDDDDDDDASVVGIIFSTATYGTDNAGLTVGLGFGYVDEDFADNPVVQIGGEVRVARRLSLVTENWIFPEVDDPLVSYGLRFFGEQIAVDLAFATLLEEDPLLPGIPFVNFVYNF
ncbi:MAG: hypothetical protein JSV52_03375 [Candidatus Zixiibacteriota bacterium]|nr:MAG: hypothetical protein JSV52_03375 [candidate division Zixibacteria bacterium]